MGKINIGISKDVSTQQEAQAFLDAVAVVAEGSRISSSFIETLQPAEAQ